MCEGKRSLQRRDGQSVLGLEGDTQRHVQRLGSGLHPVPEVMTTYGRVSTSKAGWDPVCVSAETCEAVLSRRADCVLVDSGFRGLETCLNQIMVCVPGVVDRRVISRSVSACSVVEFIRGQDKLEC